MLSFDPVFLIPRFQLSREAGIEESEAFMKNVSNVLFLCLGFCLPAVAAAQAVVTTLLVKTDMSCNWKLDGQPMSPLKADDATVVPISPGEHLIEATTTDGVATVRTKVEIDHSEKTVNIQLRNKYDQQLKLQHAETLRERTGAPPGPTWTDASTGLMWTRKDNGSDVDWHQASAYCSKLQLEGYKDWRLPTIDELQGLYDPSANVPSKFDNGETYNVRIKGHLQLTGWDWSSSQSNTPGFPWMLNSDGGHKPGNAFAVGFSYSMRALCVRSSGE